MVEQFGEFGSEVEAVARVLDASDEVWGYAGDRAAEDRAVEAGGAGRESTEEEAARSEASVAAGEAERVAGCDRVQARAAAGL